MKPNLPLLLLFSSLTAAAQEPATPPPAATPAPAPAPAAPATPSTPLVPDSPGISLSVPWTGATGSGVSFGMEEGGWSGAFGSGLRMRVPIGKYVGIVLRGAFVTGYTPAGGTAVDYPGMHLGGRLEVIGMSPVFLNLVRLYGGGGVELFSAVGPHVNHDAKIGGGGHFGFEFFASRWSSFYLEIGGHSEIDKGMPGGQTIIVGMHFYPFSG